MLLLIVTSFFLYKTYLQLDKDLALILSPKNAVGRWTWVALEIKWKVTECSFCPKKAALDMECHRQLFLPHQRTCYKDSPTWVEIMPPIPAPKHTLSCSIVQGGRIGKNVETVQCVLLSKGMQNTGTATFFAWCARIALLINATVDRLINSKRQERVERAYTLLHTLTFIELMAVASRQAVIESSPSE